MVSSLQEGQLPIPILHNTMFPLHLAPYPVQSRMESVSGISHALAEHLAGHSEGKDDENTDRYGLFSGLDAFPRIITRSTQAALGLWASAVINTLALNLIADVMEWDNAVATREYAWLRLMSDVKYDGYSDFRSGIRFLESLVTWLKQFEPANRATAYQFVKDRMVYISAAEMQRVIELFVPETVIPYLRPYRGRAVWGQTLRRVGQP